MPLCRFRPTSAIHPLESWPSDEASLETDQRRLGALNPHPWSVPSPPYRVGGAVVVGAAAGGRAAAVVLRGRDVVAVRVLPGPLAAPYLPGLLALREGPLLAAAVGSLAERPDVLLVAAAGRDHERSAGLAVHLGALLGLPTVGVTDRPLLATGPPPGPRRGDTSPLLLDGAVVARWVRTVRGVRPVVAHAGWRTGAATAADVVLAATGGVRMPEPLREARRRARAAPAGSPSAGQPTKMQNGWPAGSA